jgi:hypothetical protein
MHPERLAQRVPSRRRLGIAMLADFEMRFHKRGRDRSGKCSIIARPGGAVHGVVYEIAEMEKPWLDAAEGEGYAVLQLRVRAGDGELAAFTYVARESHIEERLAPFHWYRELVISGARHHGLPTDYIERLETVACVRDHDERRAGQHLRLARWRGAR